MLVRLKIVILRRGISQAKLAQAIGRTPAHVSRLIRGRVRVRARDRRRISGFLGVSETQLFPSRKRPSRSTIRPESDRARAEDRRDA
jgi:transcriptional regulator with XRE-family HTH domain